MSEVRFGAISPLEGRYKAAAPDLHDRLAAYLSEEAGVWYQAKVEVALARALARRGLCDPACADEIARAAEAITPEEVNEEEKVTRHNIRALVNVLRSKVSERARPFIHLTATSFDIVDTARSLQLRDVARDTVIPLLRELLRLWIDIARREAETPQVGRTHGQHAVPITFGFAVSAHISRLGERIEAFERAAGRLVGKFSGAVGAYNAVSLFFDDPQAFEAEVLRELDLQPADQSTQIVPAEYVLDYLHVAVSTLGVLADFADDIRQLQRTEIAEVGEAFEASQVGSSTMPHKRNPWNFEHVKSLWKTFQPRITTAYMDQLSEHQRDLTNSASARFYGEIVFGLSAAAHRLTAVCRKLVVDRGRMQANLQSTAAMTVAEPLYVLLAAAGHPDAHETVRRLTLEAESRGTGVLDVLESRDDLRRYVEALTPEQRRVLAEPAGYTGVAAARARAVCDRWEARLGLGEGEQQIRARVWVRLKPGVLDPQGQAVQGSLAALGYEEVQAVRVGKAIELTIQADNRGEARRRIEEMGRRLLANPVIERFEVDLD